MPKLANPDDIKKAVLQVISGYPDPPIGRDLDVVKVRQDEECWYVYVKPKRRAIAESSNYHDFLAGVERVLQDEQNLNITLMPVMPDEE